MSAVTSSAAVGAEAVDVLFREAELLDEWRLREWLALLTEDVRYQVPVRIAKERGDPDVGTTGVSTEMHHLDALGRAV